MVVSSISRTLQFGCVSPWSLPVTVQGDFHPLQGPGGSSDLCAGYEARKVASAPERCSDECRPGVSLPFLKTSKASHAVTCKAYRRCHHSSLHLRLTPPLPATPLPSAALVSSLPLTFPQRLPPEGLIHVVPYNQNPLLCVFLESEEQRNLSSAIPTPLFFVFFLCMYHNQ